MLFDASRLITRDGATPTGIDRVDFAYLNALAADPELDLRLIVFDPFGPGLMPRDSGKRLIKSVTQRWRQRFAEDGPQELFNSLRAWLEAPAGAERPQLLAPPSRLAPVARLAPHIGLTLRRPWGKLRLERLREDGVPTVYLNTSHARLFLRSVPRWLDGHATARGVFFVHDLIPIEFPEFSRQREAERHAARMRTVSSYARRVLVNSEATRAAFEDYLGQRGMRLPPVSVLPLGVESRVLARQGQGTLRPAVPYFMVLSTIEPRKNHQLLLEVWRRCVRDDPQGAPRLLVVGQRGWENNNIFNMLDRMQVSRHVVECSGLSDAQLGLLLRHARALLSPSLAEGFGLPVAEALASGTPVLASSIAAHREVGGDCAEYLDPLDGLGWLRKIREYAAPASPQRKAQLARVARYRPPTWEGHLSAAMPLLKEAAC